MVEERREEQRTTVIERREEMPVFKEVYPVIEPHAYVAIAQDSVTGQLKYVVMEPTLFEQEQQMLKKITSILYDELDVSVKELTAEKAEEILKENVKRIVKDYKFKMSESTLQKILYYIVRDFIGYGKIDVMMRDHMIEDISCDGPNIPIYVWHREYESLPTNVVFDAEELNNFVVKLAYKCGKHISVAQPIMDGTLPDGSRVNATYGTEVSRKGSTFTIRRFRADPLTITDLIKFRTISVDIAAYLWLAVENRCSLLVAGGVASGKTTMLNCTSMFIRPELKIVTIEDTAELQLPHQNWISLVSRTGFGLREAEVSLFDLLKAAMRQRPDYIIVGEIRGAEAYTLFQALATGHGVQSTIHAEDALAVIERLESPPMNIPRALIGLVDIIMVQSRVRIGEKAARRTITLTEVKGYTPGVGLELQDVFRWNPREDRHEMIIKELEESAVIRKVIERRGLSYKEVLEELERRKVILEWMVKKNIRRYTDVGNVVREYYMSPENVYIRAKVELASS
ncbi:MAG: type IV secretory pathway protein [Candidatus Methanomethylicota archaeon]|uniref:Type IV secretory pathway protein n=1 Tax=Thermoproteota archaeon TaxID=2056631 RepID=A0A497ESC5_9CREN|nr:MAG: type IV secretory pathway protein [Candidatus Verstraetearchaeota archaeon]